MQLYNRRRFLGTLGQPVAALAIATLHPEAVKNALAAIKDRKGKPEEIAADERFWRPVQQAYTVDRSLVNLNNGGVSPSPAIVQNAMKRHLDYSNEAPVYTMWRILEPQREGVRKRMARAFKCSPEEIALTRNASEGLEICQLGFDLVAGDEILTTTQDYGRMITTFKQRERREGVVLKQIKIPVPAENDREVVRLFEAGITPRTKLILACHMINLTGQILPVRDIVRMARRKGIPVIVDGAHALAHFDFTFEDLDCDYYATSLHKWLCAPHGTGLLYVRREKIKDLWPMMPAPDTMADDIRKFEEIGTHPAANYLAIAEALTFHQGIGAANKAARLRYLRDRWAKRLLKTKRVRMHTSLKAGLACGLATVQVEGIDTAELAQHLWKQYRIIVTAIKHPEFEGLRVTPHVYTTLEEIDRFTEAVEKVIKEGLPS